MSAVDWFEQITHPDRPYLQAPWTIDIEGERWTGASDGAVMVLVSGDHGKPEFAGSEERKQSVRDYATRTYQTRPREIHLADLRALLPQPDGLPDCDECGNTGSVECEDCDGVGDFDCTCPHCHDEHETDCDACKGEGSVPCPCGRKPDVRTIVRVEIGVAHFNLHKLAKFVPHLPGELATWQQDDCHGPALLVAGPYRVIVMPLRQLDDKKPVHTIALHELAAV